MGLRISGEAPIGEHRRRYNRPVVPKFVVVAFDEQHMQSGRDIILHQRGGHLQIIKEIHPAYDALSYPLLFQMVDAGGHLLLKQILE